MEATREVASVKIGPGIGPEPLILEPTGTTNLRIVFAGQHVTIPLSVIPWLRDALTGLLDIHGDIHYPAPVTGRHAKLPQGSLCCVLCTSRSPELVAWPCPHATVHGPTGPTSPTTGKDVVSGAVEFVEHLRDRATEATRSGSPLAVHCNEQAETIALLLAALDAKPTTPLGASVIAEDADGIGIQIRPLPYGDEPGELVARVDILDDGESIASKVLDVDDAERLGAALLAAADRVWAVTA